MAPAATLVNCLVQLGYEEELECSCSLSRGRVETDTKRCFLLISIFQTWPLHGCFQEQTGVRISGLLSQNDMEVDSTLVTQHVFETLGDRPGWMSEDRLPNHPKDLKRGSLLPLGFPALSHSPGPVWHGRRTLRVGSHRYPVPPWRRAGPGRAEATRAVLQPKGCRRKGRTGRRNGLEWSKEE